MLGVIHSVSLLSWRVSRCPLVKCMHKERFSKIKYIGDMHNLGEILFDSLSTEEQEELSNV